jgi:hypothetical protein
MCGSVSVGKPRGHEEVNIAHVRLQAVMSRGSQWHTKGVVELIDPVWYWLLNILNPVITHYWRGFMPHFVP